MEFDLQALAQKFIENIPNIIGAILVIIIGFWVVNRIANFVRKMLDRKGIDETLGNFLGDIVGAFLKIMVLFSAAGMIGIETTSFLAIFGALMVGIGMALNGTIGHLASGIMLMIFRPFKVGDLVTVAGGQTGNVEGINAFNTTLKTLDNKKIIIANSNVTDNIITNISGQGTVGVELTFPIGFKDDIDKAREIILKVGEACPHVLKDPAQGVVVAELADHSVNLATRPFCNSEHYWDTFFYMQENVKKEFDKAGIGIPFPQMDVHMISKN